MSSLQDETQGSPSTEQALAAERALARLRKRVRAKFAPPPRLTVSQFADKEIVVTTGPYAGTHWNTDFAPYQREIMDAFHEPGVQIVVVQGSSQWGKTACAVNIVGYHMAHDPCPILVVEPTLDPMAKDFSKNRMDPVIQASPILRAIVSKRKEKDAENNTATKMYRGGILAIAGANSAASLASRSIRVLVLDEVDRYPLTLPGEGSTLAIAFKRTTTYKRRRRIFMISSPTLENGPIDVWHKRGDQRRYFVPCPGCGHMHPYEWKNVRWVQNDPKTARLHCPQCDCEIDDVDRVAILKDGEWRPTAEQEDNTIVSFHIWEAYSPFSSLEEIVKGFLQARQSQKRGDRSEMHTWMNTTLGEPVKPQEGEGVESHVLLARREIFDADVPTGACVLTMGVDIQNDRIEALVFGWGPGEESWIVDRQVIPGDTSQGDVWGFLADLLEVTYLHKTGHRLPIRATCIDSAGHRTSEVYAFVAKHAARRVFAIVGRDGPRPIVSSPSPRKWGAERRKVPLYTIGVDTAKSLLVSRMNVSEAGPGCMHIPIQDWADEELAEQLCSERLESTWKKGVLTQTWVKNRPRNEMLDCAVYALAALKLLHPDYVLMMGELDVPPEAKDQTTKPRVPRERWVPRRRGWLH